jgi:hypothetical protein
MDLALGVLIPVHDQSINQIPIVLLISIQEYRAGNTNKLTTASA